MTETQSFIKKWKKWIVGIILILIALFFLFGSPKGWDIAEKYLDRFEIIEKEKLKKYEDSIRQGQKYHELYVDSIENIETVILPNFYNELKQSEYEKQQLLKLLDSILYAYNTQRRLDSFADHVKYR